MLRIWSGFYIIDHFEQDQFEQFPEHKKFKIFYT